MGRHIVKYKVNRGILPSGYEQLEYVVCNSGQYTTLNYYPSGATSFEAKALLTDNTTYHTLVGTRVAYQNKQFAIWSRGDSPNQRWDYGNNPNVFGEIVDLTTPHIYKMTPTQKLYDDILVGTHTPMTDACTTPLDLCCMNNNNAHVWHFSGYVYYFKIWEGDTLLYNLIPAKRISDDAIGFYNAVTGSEAFYPSSSTPYEAGPSVIEEHRGLVVSREGEAPVVPPGYTQLTYIRTTGTQYINTGLPAKDTTGFKLDISTTEAGYERGIIATSNGNTHFVLQNHSSGAAFYFTAPTGGTVLITSFYPDYGIRHLIRYNDDGSKKCYRDETYLTTNSYTLKEQINNPLFLFSRNGYSTPSVTCGKFTFYEGWIYDAGVEIMHLVPAKDSNGVAGLYDTVSGSFLTNQGTGVFEEGESSTRILPHAIKTKEANN